MFDVYAFCIELHGFHVFVHQKRSLSACKSQISVLDVLIMNNTLDLNKAGFSKTYYRLSDNQECNLFFKDRAYFK